MKEFTTVQKTFVKSKNSTDKINQRYTYSLICFAILTLILTFLLSGKNETISLIKSIFLSLIITFIFSSIIKYIKKENINSLFKDNTIDIAIIIGLFGVGTNILVLAIAILISLIIKYITKNINISSSIYGILLIILYKYFTNDLYTPLINLKKMSYYGTYNEIVKSGGSIIDYLIGTNYLSPILSLVVFIYLFQNKSIKYNLVFSYILPFFMIMLFYGLFNNMNIWYVFFQMTTGSIIFLSVYLLTDYMASPTTSEVQVLYGMTLGIISSILRFIIPELSIIITIIIGELFLVKPFEKLSSKLKYNKKIYYTLISICLFISVITIILLSVIF